MCRRLRQFVEGEIGYLIVRYICANGPNYNVKKRKIVPLCVSDLLS